MPKQSVTPFKTAIDTSTMVVLGLFVLHLLRLALEIPTVAGGIVPRNVYGLKGILLAPLIHASWGHLFANALPLWLLLTVLLADRKYYPWLTLALIWFISGAGTWLIGRGHSVHVGISGVIFGLASYLIVAGFMMRRLRSALISAVVLLLFGGMFLGVLPRSGPISWECHLCGAIAGVWAAWHHFGES